MKITSSAFSEGQTIPAKYTCDGSDINPPLAFVDVPTNAASLALVMDDPDAPGGTWDHWIVWNMSRDLRGINEAQMPDGVLGRNSWKKNAWGGPCPPDREHRYYFKLYALDTQLDLPAGSAKADLERSMKDHIVAEAQLMGRYDRKR